MRVFFLLLLILPLTALSRDKKSYPNPCDSLQRVVEVGRPLGKQELTDHIFGVLKSYKSTKADEVQAERLNDSTIVGSVIFVIEKVTEYKEDDVFGKYIIPHHSDGKIAAKFVFNIKEGKYRYEFYDLQHYDCGQEYGALCSPKYDNSSKVVNGLRIQFYRRVEKISELILKAANPGEW